MEPGGTWVISQGSLGAPGEGPGVWAASHPPQDPGRFWLDWLCLVEPLALWEHSLAQPCPGGGEALWGRGQGCWGREHWMF